MGLVVLDEVHYLGDPSRGSVWEEVIINCPKHIQLCAMSATVANADSLGGWINEVGCAVLCASELSCQTGSSCLHLVQTPLVADQHHSKASEYVPALD